MLQDIWQLFQTVYFKIRHDVRARRTAGTVEPAGAQPGVLAAEDVACQAVADDHGQCGVKVRDAREAVVKIALFRLVEARVLRNENFLKIVGDPGALQPAVLRVRHAVRGQIQAVARGKPTEQRLCAGHEPVADAEIAAVAFFGILRVVGAAKGLKQQGKTLNEHLLAWDFTALKALPLLLVDAAVERERFLRGGDAELPQRAEDAVALRFAEVEQSIVEVQKQIADHGSCTGPFSCA